MLTGEVTDSRKWQRIWQLHIPPKVKLFCWQLASSFLPTRDALLMKNVPCSQVCHMCRSAEETAYHLFVDCPEMATMWAGLGLPTMQTAEGNCVDWFFALLENLHVDLLCQVVMVCWGIWTSRNNNLWSGTPFVRTAVTSSALSFLDN